MKLLVLTGLLCLGFFFFGTAQLGDSRKINGVSLVAEQTALDTTQVVPITNIGANWAAVIPFGFMEDPHKPRLAFNGKWQWYGERIEGAREGIQALHRKGLAVMLKPQLWVGHGVYTGEVAMNSEDDWKKLEANYRIFIRAFAELARDEQVAMLCIGTEMTLFTKNRPGFFRELIRDIKTVYPGKLTYAANWDEYSNVEFWDELDYIGVDAYFPLTETVGGTKEELMNGWGRWMLEMDSISERFDKKVLFTEFGYRSVAECAIQPWAYKAELTVNEDAQSIALEALFSVAWSSPNIAGGFLWKWHPDHVRAGGKEDGTYTVQNKKAQAVVQRYFSE